jgi:CYTH domain-containing protein
MRKWNASMPRERAPAGAANVVLAFRTNGGSRVELECKMAYADAKALMDQAIQMMKNYKAPAASKEGGEHA